jgi:hypothetical protein
MQITTAQNLQSHFKSGLQIAGEDTEGNLVWMGTEREWVELDLIDEQSANDINV